uniref:Uncharacterized protein n=1 Tax=Anguilla anguilla TaxID=7936 RepID=A0A0E9XF76_ANGAN
MNYSNVGHLPNLPPMARYTLTLPVKHSFR